MKRGNQFYLTISIVDNNDNEIDVNSILKAQFNIGNLTKTYGEMFDDVIYNENDKQFMIWLTEEETFGLKEEVKMDIRILFNDNTIIGTPIQKVYFYDSLKEVPLNED